MRDISTNSPKELFHGGGQGQDLEQIIANAIIQRAPAIAQAILAVLPPQRVYMPDAAMVNGGGANLHGFVMANDQFKNMWYALGLDCAPGPDPSVFHDLGLMGDGFDAVFAIARENYLLGRSGFGDPKALDMFDGDGVSRNGVGGVVEGVRNLVLGVVEGDLNNGGGDGVGDPVSGDGVEAANVPFVITPKMRERLTPPLVFSPELRKTFIRHWFEKGTEGDSPPSDAGFRRYGLGLIFSIALDCFNRGSAFQAAIYASGASTRATTD